MFFVVEDEQVTEEADMLYVNIVVGWKGVLAEGIVVWNDLENNVKIIIKDINSLWLRNTTCRPGGGGGGGGGEGGGGALGQVLYGGVQLRGPNPYPILGKAGLRKHTLF